MKENFPIKDILKKITRHKRGATTRTIMHPYREWTATIGISVLIVAGAALWGAYLYSRYDTTFFDENAVVVQVPYKSEIVKRALEDFRSRKEDFNAGTENILLPDRTEEVVVEEADEQVTPLEASSTEPVSLINLRQE